MCVCVPTALGDDEVEGGRGGRLSSGVGLAWNAQKGADRKNVSTSDPTESRRRAPIQPNQSSVYAHTLDALRFVVRVCCLPRVRVYYFSRYYSV